MSAFGSLGPNRNKSPNPVKFRIDDVGDLGAGLIIMNWSRMLCEIDSSISMQLTRD